MLKSKRYLIHDRDPLFTAEFLSTLTEAGAQSVKLPPRSPNLNSYAERFIRSIKESRLERMILFGEDALRAAVIEFIAHYHGERNHQGIIFRDLSLPNRDGPAPCQSRLGGMLNYYDRAA